MLRGLRRDKMVGIQSDVTTNWKSVDLEELSCCVPDVGACFGFQKTDRLTNDD